MVHTMNREHMAVLSCQVFFFSKAHHSYSSMKSGEAANAEWGRQHKGA